MKPLAAICLHMDSLFTVARHIERRSVEALQADDPCFFAILDRFLDLAASHGVPLSLYVIGCDLLWQRHADRIRAVHEGGHEISSHSYSHPSNLGQLGLDDIRQEVGLAHDLITAARGGTPPPGFLAPAWCTSPRLLSVLIERGYRYDASLFPSFFMPVMQALLKMGCDPASRDGISVFRRDFVGNMVGPRQPYLASERRPWRHTPPGRDGEHRSILCLPVPTFFPRVGFWHSWAFKVGERTYERMLRSAIRRSQAFYLAMHPADLFDPATDSVGQPAAVLKFERMSVGIERKRRLMALAMEVIASECQVVRMDHLAEVSRPHLTGEGN